MNDLYEWNFVNAVADILLPVSCVYATRGGEFIGITGTIDKQSWSLLKQGAVLVVHINHVDDVIDGDQR